VGDFVPHAPDPYRGFAPEPHWGISISMPVRYSLPDEDLPGVATVGMVLNV